MPRLVRSNRQPSKKGTKRLDWYAIIFEHIDLRSFSNLWFWIALAVVWSSASHWVLGVPSDMIHRAHRDGGQAQVDLEDIARVNVNRLMFISRMSGLWILGFTCFILSGLMMLGFMYDVEFAQALFLLGFPLSMVGLLNLSTARLIESEGVVGTLLHKRLFRCRLYTQLVGMVAIFVTALWGMLQNMTIGVLG